MATLNMLVRRNPQASQALQQAQQMLNGKSPDEQIEEAKEIRTLQAMYRES